MPDGDHRFILWLVAFFGFIIFIVGLGAPESLISEDTREKITLPSESERCLEEKVLGCFWDNITFFFKLTLIDSNVQWFVLLVLTPLLIALGWAILSKLPFIGG